MPRLAAGFIPRRAVAAALCAAAALCVFPIAAHADDAFLRKVDASLNKWDTLDYGYKIRTTKAGERPTMIELRMRMRRTPEGNEQLTELSAPADMAGMKILIQEADQMYIYLPAFKKIRRVASHVNEQGFLGTSLSSKELALTRYSRYYDVAGKAESGGRIHLKLKERSGTGAPYERIDLFVNKDKLLPEEIHYYSAGKHIKTETRSDMVCEDGYCLYKEHTVKDLKSGVTSQLRLVKHRVNPKLSPKLFRKRALQ